MRRLIACVNLVFSTIVLSCVALTVSLFCKDGETIHRIGRFWARLHLKICGITVEITGADHLVSPPYVFMCNHQSALDIYTLLGFLPVSFRWIAKRQLFNIPFLGWAMGRAGYISIDRENPREALKAMEEAAKNIRGGINIIIFPEGTRSVDGRLLPFKKGGFSLALKAMVPIIPMAIHGTDRLQPKGNFIPLRKGVIYIDITEPIVLDGMDRSAKTKVMDDVRKRIEGLLACRVN